MEIKSAGLLTTIQDSGRYGFRKYGIIVSGAMDGFAHRIANILVGNEEKDAVLEATLIGPKILIKEDTLISICGGDLSPQINNCDVPMWRPVYVKGGSILSFSKCVVGSRTYVAFAGSFNIEKIMESKSTYMRAEIGGYEGRALKKGDVLKLNDISHIGNRIANNLLKDVNCYGFAATKWFIGGEVLPKYDASPIVRVIADGQYDCFDDESKKNFFQNKFMITSQSDRMGYRLKGNNLSLKEPLEMISEAVSLGTVQVPADGNPIILLADRQTTGGYPKIAQVISVDIPIIAQLKPGDRLGFQKISLEEAQSLYILREMYIEDLKRGIKIKME
ncbi:biotin-dependent carboxyltransferase family protein [Clostridium aestuarii]|uniref:Biotin-dependent carboxyltransferase family protein n=1 Tax=Clostridium aestuarii TaxID=338193 RepID=A0ABT4D395_9CLOT|nr:biotin-dependent carboxyltransferase family protein [Clostridium aestuarii]